MKSIIFSFFLVFVTSQNLYARSTKLAEVEERENGIYTQSIKSEKDQIIVGYFVDTQAKLCFARFLSGIAHIPCASLANRSEWKKIITWSE